MSEKPKQPAYIHRTEFNEMIENMGKTMTEQLGKFAMEMDEATSKKINANAAEFSKGMDGMNQRIDQVTNALNQIVTHLQQAPQQQAATNKITDLANQAQQILELPIVRQKLGISDGPSPMANKINQLSDAVSLSLTREVENAFKLSIRKALKRGTLFPDEVAGLIEDTAAVKHGI